ncbi:MAG TPA: protein kinase [Polyangiaceae bacterium]|nr:protein kinase [Polyangiaceae bacterium]
MMSEPVALTQGLPSHIRPGMVIAGKYRLEEEIGRGSMGTVYRAVHVTLGQRVAIKLISSEHSQSSEARQRFRVEAKAAAKLRSRHVVQVYDDGETPEGNPYIVLEYLDGETLEQRLQREHDVPIADAVRIANHVGRALARAHAQGIVHRDLKPANIFLVKTDDDELGWIAKVLDFGIAKLENSEQGTTRAGTVLGTPLFMSPEQVRGASSVDHRADLYSLGMCLYHMLTGEFAFYSPSYSEILVSICTEPLPLLRAKAPWVSEIVEQWFQRACAKEPLERFQSADEMTEALAAAAGTAPLAKHQSVPEGRIAPETLVGYAAPAMATIQHDTSPLSLARTQAVVQPGRAAPHHVAVTGTSPGHAGPQSVGGRLVATIPIGIGGEHATTGSRWQTPPHHLKPWVIGLGLGVLALLMTVLTLLLIGGTQGAPTSPRAGATAALSASPPAAAAVRTEPPVSGPPVIAPATADPGGSSVATETAPEPVAPKAKPKQSTNAPKGGAWGPTRRDSPSSARPPSAPEKAPGSDLGF